MELNLNWPEWNTIAAENRLGNELAKAARDYDYAVDHYASFLHHRLANHDAQTAFSSCRQCLGRPSRVARAIRFLKSGITLHPSASLAQAQQGLALQPYHLPWTCIPESSCSLLRLLRSQVARVHRCGRWRP